MKKRILLVDTFNFIFRAYHALPPLTTSGGIPTGAVRGFLAMLRSLMNDVPTDYFACVADAPGPTFRNELYPEYKANRPETPPDLKEQIPLTFEGIKKMGIPLIIVPGIEADDTIGTITKMAETQGIEVIIATGDKDFAQLVDDNTRIINTMGIENTWLDAQGVLTKFGVPPNRIIDYLALMGDKIDNVPGVPKCGAVTAAKWIKEYGSLDDLMTKAGEVKGKIGENLRASLDFLPIARKLVTIKTDADIHAELSSIEALRLKPVDKKELFDYYQRLEFRRWAKELSGESEISKVKPEDKKEALQNKENLTGATLDLFAQESVVEGPEELPLEIVRNPQEAQKAIEEIKASPNFSFFLLTQGKGQQEILPLGLAISLDKKNIYVPVGTFELLSPEGLSSHEFTELFGPLLQDKSIKKQTYDLKTCQHALANAGLKVEAVEDDVMLQSYVIGAHKSHVIEKLAYNWLQKEIASEEDLLGKGMGKREISQVPVQELATFASARADVIKRLSKLFKATLEGNEKLNFIYQTIEMPLSTVLFKMEQNGVLIDSELLAKQTLELTAKAAELEEKAYQVSGERFKLSSPKQLGEVLFDRLGVLVGGVKPRKGASGAYSTSEEVLSEIAPFCELARIVLEYRGLTKLITTYTEKLPKMVDPKDGRVHTTFEQAVAVTGRLSSTNPNLQNIPIRTEEGRKVREAFIAPEGSKIISADYSQIELRIMAHLSEDRRLVDAFHHNEDIHRATASEVFDEPISEVTPNERRIAKVINFGLMYGMSAFGLAKNLEIDRKDAVNYINKYFERYTGVRRYMDETRALANDQGYVETVFGRRLYLPDIKAGGARRAAAERAAINAPMQGTAADLIKLSMIAVQKWLEDSHLRSKLILQIHDELIIEAPLDEVELVKQKLPELMDSVIKLRVPLVAEVGVGDNWETAH